MTALVDTLLIDLEAGGGKDALPLLAFTIERLSLLKKPSDHRVRSCAAATVGHAQKICPFSESGHNDRQIESHDAIYGAAH